MTATQVAARLAALLVWAVSAPALAQDRAFVEVDASHETCFVGEPIDITLCFGFDMDLELIQPYSQELGVPVRVQAPWVMDLPGTIVIDTAPEEGATFALNDDVARASPGAARAMDGRHFVVFEYTRSYRPVREGDLEVFAVLEYSFATRFEEDFVNGRVALDPQTAEIIGKPLEIAVRPLPEDGRPEAFTGGVGRFTVRADATPRHLYAGETLKLVLTIEGEGNLASLSAPRLDELGGFHVYGSLDDGGAPVRTITYDVSPQMDALTEVPAIPFAYFDPAPPAGYRTVHTEPIPLVVRERTKLPGEPGGPPNVALPGAPGAFGALLGLGAVAPMLAIVVLAALIALVLFLRRRQRNRVGAAARAASASPAATFHARADRNLDDALVQYLAVRLDCPPASVIDPRLIARLADAGVPDELATRAATLVEGLVAYRYGGGAPEVSVESARALVDDLEKHLSPATPARR